jgi:hypothetical protein
MNRLRGLFLIILMILLQVCWYIIGTRTFFQNGDPEGSDFRWFYSVGKVFREYGSSHVYDLDLARVYQAQVAGVPVDTEKLLLPNHPPFVFPLMALLAGLDYRTAYYLYFALVLLIVISSSTMVYQALRRENWPQTEAFITIAGLALFEPFFVSILKGQDTFLLYLGGLFLLTGWMLEKDWLAGIGLGLTLVRPQIALVLVIPLLVKRRKIWWWFVGSAVALALYSFMQVGWNGMLDYLHVLSMSTGVKGYGWDEVGMLNLVGLMLRVAPGLNVEAVHIIGWAGYAVALVGLFALSYFSKQLRFWHLSVAVSLSLFSAPHLHYHDLALLAIPIIGLGVAGIRHGKFKVTVAASMLTAISIVLLLAELWIPVRNTVPYLVMTVLPILTWWCESRHGWPKWKTQVTTRVGTGV